MNELNGTKVELEKQLEEAKRAPIPQLTDQQGVINELKQQIEQLTKVCKILLSFNMDAQGLKFGV